MSAARLKSATSRPEFWIVAALTAVAALLRFATLTTQSFWLDEATTVHELGLSFGGLLHAVHSNETTPPLYFILAWLWTHIFGTGEAGVRSLSAVCGTAMIPLAYGAGRELISRSAGVVVALLVAISPLMLWYSQEARSYMLLATLLAAALWLWARALRTHARADLAGWAVCSALAVATHFFAGFLIAPEGLWLLWTQRSRTVLVACGFLLIVQLALLPLAIGDTKNLLDWLKDDPLSERLHQLPVLLGASQLYLSDSPLARDGLIFAAVWALVVAGVILWRGGTAERRGAAAGALLAAAALLVPVLLALGGWDYVVGRNMIGAFLPLMIVLAAAVAVPRARVLGLVLLGVTVIGFGAADISTQTDSTFMRPDWRGVASALGTMHPPRAVIIDAGDVGEEPLTVYLPGTFSQFSYSGLPAPGPAVRIGEVDVVGQSYQSVATPLPKGVSMIGGPDFINGLQVVRFLLTPDWSGTPAQLLSTGAGLLTEDQSSAPSVLLQR